MNDTIYFYEATKKNGFLSNFYESPIVIDGELWRTVEHYFQAMKFPDYPEYQQTIREVNTPAISKRLGRSRKYKIRPDWEEVKDKIMYKALRIKFMSNGELCSMLIDTDDSLLVEHSRDIYWADGGSNKGVSQDKMRGKNRLGVLLMAVRDEMKMYRSLIDS